MHSSIGTGLARVGLIWIGVLMTLFSFVVFADTPAQNTQCTWLTDGKPYGYCVTKTLGSTNPDFVYYLHGASLEQDAWISPKENIWPYWASQGMQAPTVITLGFGPIFLLAQKNHADASGHLEFVTHYIPRIEEELGGLKGRRILLGQSMGGFNAIQMAMKHPEMFAKIAINCPDIVDLDPYASADDQQVYLSTTVADATHTYWELLMERIFFANDGSWNDAAPLTAASHYLGPQTPPLFISGGEQDQFGFFPGTQRFVKIAQDKGVSVQWMPVDGAHCSYDLAGVSQFLIN